MLCLERRMNQKNVIVIPPSDKPTVIEETVLGFTHKHGVHCVSLGFKAPPHVRIDRQEVYEAKMREAEEARRVRVGAGREVVEAEKETVIA